MKCKKLSMLLLTVLILLSGLTAGCLTVFADPDVPDPVVPSGSWSNFGVAIADNLDDGVLEIATAEELAYFAARVNERNADYIAASVKLTQDIDLSAHYWVPIGYTTSVLDIENYAFKGSFDGNGNRITGLSISGTDLQYVGLFGYLTDAKVEDLYVSGSVKGAAYVGGIAGNYITF